MSVRLQAALAGVVVLVSACPSNDCFIGDQSKDPEIGLVYRSSDGVMHELAAGGQVPLILPPQGGKVMFIGVRAKNIDGCPVTLTASLRDQCTNNLVALEERPVTLEATGDGWLTPKVPTALENYSNLPACPRASIDRDINNEPYELTIKVEDKTGRKGSVKMMVTPACMDSSEKDQCECECAAEYRQGLACSGEHPDSGVPPGTCPTDGGMIGGDR